jgi:hypothetical protein
LQSQVTKLQQQQMAHIKTISVLNEQSDKMKERLALYEELPNFGNDAEPPLTSRPLTSPAKNQEVEAKQKMIEVS